MRLKDGRRWWHRGQQMPKIGHLAWAGRRGQRRSVCVRAKWFPTVGESTLERWARGQAKTGGKERREGEEGEPTG
eukprot:6204176-Pleurochrysis_carterae.AAC.1